MLWWASSHCPAPTESAPAPGILWTGTLTIPTPGGKPSVVTDKASGVFGLLSKLDGQYREIEGKPEQSPAGPAD